MLETLTSLADAPHPDVDHWDREVVQLTFGRRLPQTAGGPDLRVTDVSVVDAGE